MNGAFLDSQFYAIIVLGQFLVYSKWLLNYILSVISQIITIYNKYSLFSTNLMTDILNIPAV